MSIFEVVSRSIRDTTIKFYPKKKMEKEMPKVSRKEPAKCTTRETYQNEHLIVQNIQKLLKYSECEKLGC